MSTSFIGDISFVEVCGNVYGLYFMLEELKKKSRKMHHNVVVRRNGNKVNISCPLAADPTRAEKLKLSIMKVKNRLTNCGFAGIDIKVRIDCRQMSCPPSDSPTYSRRTTLLSRPLSKLQSCRHRPLHSRRAKSNATMC